MLDSFLGNVRPADERQHAAADSGDLRRVENVDHAMNVARQAAEVAARGE